MEQIFRFLNGVPFHLSKKDEVRDTKTGHQREEYSPGEAAGLKESKRLLLFCFSLGGTMYLSGHLGCVLLLFLLYL